MSDRPDGLESLTEEELSALVDLAEAYRDGGLARRDLLKAAGVGGVAGLVGGAGWSAATGGEEADREPSADPAVRTVAPVARPGQVQQAIDRAAETGGGKVMLDPTERYEQPSTPWAVREDVILDFNGAILRGTGTSPDTDILHVYPGARLHDPRIDLHDGGDGYTDADPFRGRVFSLDTRFGKPYFADGTTIRGGGVRATGGAGTACYLGVNTTGVDSAITHIDLEFDIGIPRGSDTELSLDTALHLDTTGANRAGYINGVRVSGHWRYPNTGVRQSGVVGRFNQQTRNSFNAQIQPGDDANAFWQIEDPTWARLNVWRGIIWDIRSYSGTAWKIDSQYQDSQDAWRGCKRNAVYTLDLQPTHVRNRSPNGHFINRPDRLRSIVV